MVLVKRSFSNFDRGHFFFDHPLYVFCSYPKCNRIHKAHTSCWAGEFPIVFQYCGNLCLLQLDRRELRKNVTGVAMFWCFPFFACCSYTGKGRRVFPTHCNSASHCLILWENVSELDCVSKKARTSYAFTKQIQMSKIAFTCHLLVLTFLLSHLSSKTFAHGMRQCDMLLHCAWQRRYNSWLKTPFTLTRWESCK